MPETLWALGQTGEALLTRALVQDIGLSRLRVRVDGSRGAPV